MTNQGATGMPAPWLTDRRLHAALVLVAALVVYLNSLGVPMGATDAQHTVLNPFVTKEGALLEPDQGLLRHELAPWVGRRQVTYLSFALNYRLHQDAVWGYHAASMAAHAAASLTLYLLVLTLFASPRLRGSLDAPGVGLAALGAAMLFAVHPMGTEAVTPVYHRGVPLAALFYMASVLAYAAARNKGPEATATARLGLYALSFALGLLAVKSRENAVTLPLMLTIVELVVYAEGSLADRARRLGPYYLLALAPVAATVGFHSEERGVLGTMADSAAGGSTATSMQYLATELRALLIYLRLIFLPLGQSASHALAIKTGGLMSPLPLMALLMHAAVLGLAIHALLGAGREGGGHGRAFALGVFWFYAASGLESGPFVLTRTVGEHRAYLPGAGVYVALAVWWVGLLRGGAGRRALLGALAALALVLGGLTVARNGYWNGAGGLGGQAGAVVSSESGRALGQGIELKARGDLDGAYAAFQRATGLDPGNAVAYYNLGVEEERRGRTEEAMAAYERVIALDEGFAEAYNNLAILYQRSGEPRRQELALQHLLKAIALKPDYTAAHNNLGLIYRGRGMEQEALGHFRRALELDPGNVETYNNLGVLYGSAGSYEQAVGVLKEAIRLAPETAQPYNNLAIVYSYMGRYREAVENFERALALDPDYPRARQNYETLMRRLSGAGAAPVPTSTRQAPASTR